MLERMHFTRCVRKRSVSRPRQRGQTLVEFALVVLIFLWSRLDYWSSLEHCGPGTRLCRQRARSRFAVVETPTTTDAEIKNYVVYLNSAGTGDLSPWFNDFQCHRQFSED